MVDFLSKSGVFALRWMLHDSSNEKIYDTILGHLLSLFFVI